MDATNMLVFMIAFLSVSGKAESGNAGSQSRERSGTAPNSQYKDCAEVYSAGSHDSGVYAIHPTSLPASVEVYCDMLHDGGGWTVFQRRKDGSVNFARNWASYKQGFGDLTGEHWLGNDNIAALSSQKAYKLRIDLEDWEGDTRFAEYETFKVESEDKLYKLTSYGYTGNAGDSMIYHSGYKFSTFDRDNDIASDRDCSREFGNTGFWFYGCAMANLNGPYQNSSRAPTKYGGVLWWHWNFSVYHSLKATVMMIRPLDFQ